MSGREVVELSATDPRATVCGTCGRGWDDSVSTALTPVPAGRCPWEYEHDPACTLCGGSGTFARWNGWRVLLVRCVCTFSRDGAR